MLIEKFIPSKVIINELDTDYKAEVVAAALLQQNIDAERIFVKRKGINNRARNKDIINIRKDVISFNEEHIIIETNRESIYNYLPEGIFHSPTLGGLDKNIEDIIEQVRKQKKAEQDGRKFFEPFELETYYTELAALQIENSFDQNNDQLLNIIKNLWPLLAEIDSENAKIFIYLLPFFHQVRGNKIWFQKLMTAFLEVPVFVTYRINKVDEPEHFEDLLLSKTILGISSLLCGSHSDGNKNWQVNIGPIDSNEIYKYIPGSAFNKLLQTVYDYCVPATVACYQHCITKATKNSFTLSPTYCNENFLGYTTFI